MAAASTRSAAVSASCGRPSLARSPDSSERCPRGARRPATSSVSAPIRAIASGRWSDSLARPSRWSTGRSSVRSSAPRPRSSSFRPAGARNSSQSRPTEGRCDLADAPPLVADVVDEDVLAQPFGLDVERAAGVDLGHLVDEVHEVMSAREHEGVDRDLLASATHDLAQGLLEGAFGRWVVKARVRVARLEVRGGLAVGDEDDLLVLAA